MSLNTFIAGNRAVAPALLQQARFASTTQSWRIGDIKLQGALAESNEKTVVVFPKDTIEFTSELNREFAAEVKDLHDHRRSLHASIKDRVQSGKFDSLEASSAAAKDPSWKVAPPPEKMEKRRVEITGPANDPAMVINMLNSGADACMIDLEDSMAPSAVNVLDGHYNIYQAARARLAHDKKLENGEFKRYQIGSNPANMTVRVRGLHMNELHATAAHYGAVPATLFDIGVHLANNGKYLQERGMGPWLYMPKLHSGFEADVLNRILAYSEKELGLESGATKVTTLIETLPAVFETHDIAYALRDRLIGQNCGRWDWLANRSYYLSADPTYVHPDRAHTGMEQSFNMAYSQMVVQTAHQRGFHAMGGMSAFIPVSGDAEQSAIAMEKVKADKDLEISNGHDGAWVAHPGMVEPVLDQFKSAFGAAENQKNSDKNLSGNISAESLVAVDSSLRDTSKRSEDGLRQNIRVALQYMDNYLNGRGAAAINNMMEDLATFEMSRHSIRSWIDSGVQFTNSNGSSSTLTLDNLDAVLEEEFAKVRPVGAAETLAEAKEVLRRGVHENPEYISNISQEYLNPRFARAVTFGSTAISVIDKKDTTRGAKGIKFDADVVTSLLGSRPEVSLSGLELVRHRGRFLTRLLDNGGCYKFMGCASGVAAANVVNGGDQLVGPYVGGWQLNAMGLEESRPDTLWVKPEDPGNLANVLNNFLQLQDKIIVQDLRKELASIANGPKDQFHARLEALQQKANGLADYHDIAMLADFEQGYGDPKYIRYAVTKAIQNGITVLHIEDQGPKKRCGHLGDKELDTFEHAVEIMKAANYAAQELLGEDQADEQFAKFTFRTDALSALRIVYSKNLEDPNCIDHQFIDWERGATPDGKYLYLKKGINPATGNPYGLDQSIARAAEMVRLGLATFVWMETPDADIRVARSFLDGVNEKLSSQEHPHRALGLYNFSPSFAWQKNYYPEAKELALNVADFIEANIYPGLTNGSLSEETAKAQLREFLETKGDAVRGDHLFTNSNLDRLFCFAMDLCSGAETWDNKVDEARKQVAGLERSNLRFRLRREVQRTVDSTYDPIHHMANIIVGQRIKYFSSALEEIGYKAQLITLPQFHYEAERAYSVADAYNKQGIEGYVQHVQRVEEHLPERYAFLGHQKAVGTGVEAQLYENLLGRESGILSESTEKGFTSESA